MQFCSPDLKHRKTLVTRFTGLVGLVIALSYPAFGDEDLLQSFKQEIEPIMDQYCFDCHGYGISKGGVVFDEFDESNGIKDHELWLRAVRNLRSHIMPPQDEDQPSEEERAEIANWIKSKVFELNPSNPDPGTVIVRRLNRVEYRNTIKDLLGVDYDTTVEFPADDTGHGFDNIASVLTISPMLLEKYLDAAQAIIAEAVPTQPLVVAERKIPGKAFLLEGGESGNTGNWYQDFSYYTAQTASKTQQVQLSGEYEVVLNMMSVETYVDGQFDLNECQVVFKVDGETLLDRKFVREGAKSFEFTFDLELEAGEHEFTFEITPLTPGSVQNRNLRIRVNDMALRGPLDKEHWVQPRHYSKFFPKAVPDGEKDRRSYAHEILSKFAYRAFRRPVEKESVERLVSLAEYVANQDGNTFEAGVAQAMVAVLASPRFLFREESSLSTDGQYALIDEYALASRLSYFLWSTMPDSELIQLAERNELRKNLKSQVDRMLKHERSEEFITNFVGQWLQARDIETVVISDFAVWLRENPDPKVTAARKTFMRLREIEPEDRTEEEAAEYSEARATYLGSARAPRPKLSRDVRKAMREESEMVFEYILQNDRNLIELIDSDYTFLNEDLAEHYGIEGVEGEEMRKVQLPEDSPRGGVLTQGTVLAVTSNPTRTSPVKRGVFVLDNILGTPPAPPPPNIPPLEEVASEEDFEKMSLRESLAIHAKKQLCRSCHNRMDPLGLALENFNAIGRWRDSELKLPVQPEGTLITGEDFTDIRELKRILANERRNDFFYCMSEKIMTYALGRGVEYYDTDTLDHLVETLHQNNGSLTSLITEVINSAAFQKRRTDEVTDAESVADKGKDESNLETAKSLL